MGWGPVAQRIGSWVSLVITVQGKPTLGKTVYLEGSSIFLSEVSSVLRYRGRERPQMPLVKNNVPVTQASSILQCQQLRQEAGIIFSA